MVGFVFETGESFPRTRSRVKTGDFYSLLSARRSIVTLVYYKPFIVPLPYPSAPLPSPIFSPSSHFPLFPPHLRIAFFTPLPLPPPLPLSCSVMEISTPTKAVII